jgi:maltooligosyltrehalose trehalohydrolase
MSEQLITELITARRFPVGVERIADKGMHFRVWAPEKKQ